MKALLGIVPPDDALGCLQDVHWPGGDFGYFPTYTMGAIAAAQFYAAARRDVPDLEANISKGDFAPLMAWLRTHVHSQGSRVTGDALLTAATGAPLDLAGVTRRLVGFNLLKPRDRLGTAFGFAQLSQNGGL